MILLGVVQTGSDTSTSYFYPTSINTSALVTEALDTTYRANLIGNRAREGYTSGEGLNSSSESTRKLLDELALGSDILQGKIWDPPGNNNGREHFWPNNAYYFLVDVLYGV